MEQLFTFIKQAKPTLKDSSIKNYITSFKKFHRLVEDRPMRQYHYRPKTIMKEVYKMDMSDNTKKNYLSAIMNVMTCYKENGVLCGGKRRETAIEQYRQGIFALKKKVEEEKSKLKDGLTERERTNMISYEQVKAGFGFYNEMIGKTELSKEKGLTGAEFDLIQKWVLTALYSFLPPARNVYATLNVKHNEAIDTLPKAGNYIVFNTTESGSDIYIIINQHKSNKTLGSRMWSITPNATSFTKRNEEPVKINVPDGLYQVLMKWNELIGHKQQHFFVNKKGHKMTPNSMTKYLINTYKVLYPNKKISSNILRKAFHSSRNKTSNFKHHYEENKVLAESMGHSLGESVASYTKVI
jgi:hypothetical protein